MVFLCFGFIRIQKQEIRISAALQIPSAIFSESYLSVEYASEYNTIGQIGTYYVCWNVNKPLLPQE